MKTIKAKRQADKTFLHFIRATKKAVEHSPAKNTEVVSVIWNTAGDGLRQFDYDTGQYIDANDAGVPSLATKE